MTTLTQKEYITSKQLLALFICLEIVLLLILLKSAEISLICFIIFPLFFYVYHQPEFGLAMALTGRILIGLFFDNLSLELPFPILASHLIIVLSGVSIYYLKNPIRPVTFYAPQLWTTAIFIILLIGLTYSTNMSYGKQKVLFFAAHNLLLVVVPILIVDAEKKVRDILLATYILGLALAIISTFLALASPAIYRFQPSENVNPIWFSRSLGVSLIASLFLITTVKRRGLKLFILATWPVFIYPILRSWSRGPLLGVFLGLIVFFYLQPTISWRLKLIAGLFIAIGGFAMLAVTSNVILSRLQTPLTEEASAAFRILAWIEAVDIFKANPLRGIGTGSFFIDFPFVPFIWPHNIFLEAASENGIFGLFSLCMFFLTSFLLGLKNMRLAASRMTRQINIIIVTIFFFSLWNAQVSGDITGNESIWLAAGLICALAAMREKERPSDQ
ncbi:O-antigen ligase family protein [candidate division KSB1 bacterium]|nr:O-antigen ligase family protein [candidate division KSB1 bacterium]RQW11414.1 MAG: O-antigen ligase family protein [candidate division KSB1 bacterium]